MKEDVDYCDDSETDIRSSASKQFLSREAFTKQNRNMKRMHSNSILNELRLNQKINQENLLLKQEKKLQQYQKTKKNSITGIRSRKKMSDFNINIVQSTHKHRLSQFIEPISKNLIPPINFSIFSPQNKIQKRNQQNETSTNKLKEDKQFVLNSPKNKHKKLPQKPRNLILSSINNKIRQIDIISKTFDKVNTFFTIDCETTSQKYNKRCQYTSKILKQFESKLNLRKNKITERKNSLKKNTKIEYRYKVQPKRYQTEFSDKQNLQCQNKIQGLWNQNARKMKNYISGGYRDQKEDYSDFCDIEEYRRIKSNFKTFEQIYNCIKEDKDNPIGKVYKNDFKQPNILEIVSVMEKQQQLLASKIF